MVIQKEASDHVDVQEPDSTRDGIQKPNLVQTDMYIASSACDSVQITSPICTSIHEYDWHL